MKTPSARLSPAHRNAVCCLLVGLVLALPARTAEVVRVWEEDLCLPSYRLTAPDPNPMFYRGESYQGAQKRVYPYALMDGITGKQEDGTFRALYLENEFVKLCVLPEIGGRLFYATDKTNGYDFFYRQHVIKPALIGMLGAWISGGIEWCVFHHHRATTHMPVDYATRENPDGSATIWIGEYERRHRMRWVIGMTLRPDRSFIEVEVRLINRTPMPHSILYWANVAVSVNDDYQVIFPPSVQVATYHAKNDFVNWPVGQGRYRGSDYADVDLSWWKNHPQAVSCFAWDLQEDFMGGYDHGRDAGVVHVADHHVVSGAKLWEWAPGNIWDTRVLTDNDGPYAELMVGAFSDNQPDYSWIKPGEVKQFTQHWYPVRDIGGFKNANREGAANLEVNDAEARIGFHVTSRQPAARAVLRRGAEVLWEKPTDLSPAEPLVETVALEGPVPAQELRVSLLDAAGRELIAYQPVERTPVDRLPETVKPPPAPETIESIEELYFTGLRVAQIHQPTVDPTSYWQEALKRDPGDVRCNIQMGIDGNRRGLFADAEAHLRTAIKRLTTDYTRSKDTEAFHQLGLALKAQGRFEEAVEAFHRASWDQAFHSVAHYQLATLACRRGDFARALEMIEECLATNARSVRAWSLKTAILRRLGRWVEAGDLAARLAEGDPLDRWSRNELRLLAARGQIREAPAFTDSGDIEPWIELAGDYLDAGLNDEAVALLEAIEADPGFRRSPSPINAYYLAHLADARGDDAATRRWLDQAAARGPDHCFPFRPETIDVLENAIRRRPRDARARLYLGNLLFEIQPERAIQEWEAARDLEPGLALIHRNLGWAYQRVQHEVPKAIASYERAIACAGEDPRHFLELDDLYERDNTAPTRRLALLEAHPAVCAARKDLLIRRITLLVATGDYADAIAALAENQFFIAEGGGRELGDAYVDARVLEAMRLLKADQATEARDVIRAAASYPENLSQESPRNERKRPLVLYYTARIEQALGHAAEAQQLLHELVGADTSRSHEARFYQALANRELGDSSPTDDVASQLADWAAGQLGGSARTEFFTKFGEQQTLQTRRAEAHYILGLSRLLTDQPDEAAEHFTQTLAYNQSHVWARHQLSQLTEKP
ncbi:MAG: DUF5107 domain-containing protein [Verrucomicrobiales bacterium]|nr:DUF5107 domain-containing protein [Verrucomicrobiales bacterium]MCP5527378.1 DUF5107 domain-containing protein [Verrucomicrobiales bacterium]